MKKKDFVSKNEMGETWDRMESNLEKMQNLLNKPYRYSIWITNVSFALLGFYIAVLLQIRSNEVIRNEISKLIILFVIIIPILIGLFYRVKFEIIDGYKTFKEWIRRTELFINEVDNKLGSNNPETAQDLDQSISSDILDKMKRKFIITGVMLQFLFFLIALITVIVFLLKYLFC